MLITSDRYWRIYNGLRDEMNVTDELGRRAAAILSRVVLTPDELADGVRLSEECIARSQAEMVRFRAAMEATPQIIGGSNYYEVAAVFDDRCDPSGRPIPVETW